MYDLEADPMEAVNLAKEPAFRKRLNFMRAQLEKARDSVYDTESSRVSQRVESEVVTGATIE